MKKYTLFLVWCCFYFFGNTQSLQDAEKAFKQENYIQAIATWQQLAKLNFGNSSKLYNNIGIAYSKEKDMGKAILYFEKALKVDYNNEKAHRNLKIARAKLSLSNENNPLFFVDWYYCLLDLFSIHTWQLICFITIFALSILYFYQRNKQVSIIKKIIYFNCIMGIGIFIIIILKIQHMTNKNQAIITHPKAIGYKDASLTQKSNSLKLGEKIEILEQLGSIQFIKNESDSTFWIEKKIAEMI